MNDILNDSCGDINEEDENDINNMKDIEVLRTWLKVKFIENKRLKEELEKLKFEYGQEMIRLTKKIDDMNIKKTDKELKKI